MTVSFVHHVSDGDRALQLAELLQAAGVAVVPWTPDAVVDGTVVLLSAAGLAHPDWLTPATAELRLVPVRVGQIDAEQVPERLRELNWIDWQPDNLQATFGYVLAGLMSDPARRDLSRQLGHEAEAWDRSGRRKDLLIHDYRRARQLSGLLQDLKADRLAAPSATVQEFVTRSVKASRPAYRRRRRRMIFSAVGVVVALATVAALLPAIQLGKYNNSESIVTTGDPYMLQDLPEWSAANAAALLEDGTSAERDLADVTLLRALNTPWEIDALQWRIPPTSSVPFQHGTEALLSVGPELAVINVRTQRVLWRVATPGGPYELSVAPTGDTALGLSRAGAVVIDLAQHRWRQVASGTDFADGELGSDGLAVVRLNGARLAELNIVNGRVTSLGTYSAILSVAARTTSGGAAALVRDQGQHIDLIELPSRTVLASVPAGGDASVQIGGIAPDGRHAIVAGTDGQFWIFGAGEPSTPTGIAVPQIPSGVTWATGNRVIVYSEDQRGQVYYLPDSELIGTICREETRLNGLATDFSSNVVACESPGGTTFWSLPPGPLAEAVSGESASPGVSADGVTISSSGAEIRIHSPSVRTSWFQPLSSGVSAVFVADHGRQALVGDTTGEVAVIDLVSGYAATVVIWTAPDHAPISAVGWDQGPVATTRSGQTWKLADCTDCGTSTGLIDAYRARVSGCFTARQLRNISSRMWPVLGLHECDAPFGQLGRS